MKFLKILAVVLGIYVGIVIAFESLIGYFQPQSDNTLVLATADDDGVVRQRVLTRIENDGGLYVAVNHWPRAWYHRVLEFPDVTVTLGEIRLSATALRVTDPLEIAAVTETAPAPLMFRILTGFPPRYFVRLDAAEVSVPPETVTVDIPEALPSVPEAG